MLISISVSKILFFSFDVNMSEDIGYYYENLWCQIKFTSFYFVISNSLAIHALAHREWVIGHLNLRVCCQYNNRIFQHDSFILTILLCFWHFLTFFSLYSLISLFTYLFLFFFKFLKVLPELDPRITGGRARYQIGERVNVNCTSGRSKPAVKLTWFINGNPANQEYLKPYKTIKTGREGLEQTILGLKFRVQRDHFKNGDMKLKVCFLF